MPGIESIIPTLPIIRHRYCGNCPYCTQYDAIYSSKKSVPMNTLRQPLKRNITARIIKLPTLNGKNKKLGIENLKEATDITMTILKKGYQVIEDFSYPDLFVFGLELAQFKGKLPVFRAAISEIADLDTTESRVYAAFVKDRFDIENDEKEAKIEEAIDLIVDLYEHVMSTIALYQRVTSLAPTVIKALEKENAALVA